MEQLESRQMLTAAIWSNVLQPLDVVPNNQVTPLDALLIINEINNPVYSDRSTRRLPNEYTGPDAAPLIDVTCDQFVTPIDALLVINAINAGVTPPSWQFASAGGQPGTAGKFEAAACHPRLVEGSSLVTQLHAQLKLPTNDSAVRVNFEAPSFDTASVGTMRDAFEVLVLGVDNVPLSLPYRYGQQAAYNWSEEIVPQIAPGSQFTAGAAHAISSATINLSGVPANTPVKVVARLLNNDRDDNSSVIIHSVEVVAANAPVPTSLEPESHTRNGVTAIRFSSLTDVTSTFAIHYGRTTLTNDPAVIRSEFQLTNAGNLPVHGDLIAVIRSQADAAGMLLNPDGYTPDGAPYLNLTPLASSGVAAGETLAAQTIRFRLSSQERFDYTLQILSGFNQAPTLAAQASTEALVGKLSQWQLQATDPDGDKLSYALVSGPKLMSLDEQSGWLSWTPGAGDIGRWTIEVAVADRFGASVSRRFDINVREDIPNRPPIITSTPNSDAKIASPFEVLTYPLGKQPVAADILPAADGLAHVITANAGEQRLGWLTSQTSGLANSQPISLGEPSPELYPTEFITGLNVPLDLAPNSVMNLEREIYGVLSADVNRDSIPDIVVATSLNDVGSLFRADELGIVIVRFGNGDGTFREGWRSQIPVVEGRSGRIVRMHWSDVTGDDLPDLVVTTMASKQTLAYASTADGTLSSDAILSPVPGNYISTTQLADVNRDGNLDLVLFENRSFLNGRLGISIQLGDGTGHFLGDTLIAAENDYGGLGYLADADGVNGPDLIRLNYQNMRIETWLNDGTGQFGSPIYSEIRSYFAANNISGTPISPTSAYIDDFNGDGHVDALITSWQVIVLLSGQGDGKFGNRTAEGNKLILGNDSADPQWVLIAQNDGSALDFDGNGRLDFVLGDGSSGGNFTIGLQQTDGSFQLGQFNAFHPDDIGIGATKSARTTSYLAMADFNLDGVSDLVVGSQRDSTQPGSIGIFLGNAPGTLRAPRFANYFPADAITEGNRRQGRIAVAGDFNNDGFEDIVTDGSLGYDTFLYFAAGRGDGSFEPDQPVTGAVFDVVGLIKVDIDRDGNLDLVWIDGTRSGAAFGLGNGAFQMLPPVALPGGVPGVSRQPLQVDDFNQDGYPDIVMRLQTGHIESNFTTRVVVLLYDPAARRYVRLNDEQDVLTNHPRRGGYYLDESIGMGDLDNDGVKEFFIYSVSIGQDIPARFTVWKRRATTGSDASDFFTKTVIENPSFIPDFTSIHTYVVNDFNHDGKNDIAYSSHNADLTVMLGNGDFTFRDRTTYITNGMLISPGDFNDDGLTDIVSFWGPFYSYNNRPYASILLGHPDGTFSEAQAFSVSADYTPVPVVADFNGDGADDLAGLGGLKHHEVFVTRPAGLIDLETGDINGDGVTDVVSLSQDYQRIKLLLGHTSGEFARLHDLHTDMLPVALELVDADGDDLLDILTANRVGQSLSLFTHTSQDQFRRTDIPLPLQPEMMALGDFNGDGLSDVLIAGDNTLVGLKSNSNSYSVAFTLPLGLTPTGLATGDTNGDGHCDIVLTDEVGNRVLILPGRGDGTFAVPTTIPGIAGATHLALADMNADGRLDIVAAQTKLDQLGILFNRGNGRFTNAQTIRLGDAPSSLKARDANGDGRPDLLVTNRNDNTLSLILNRFDPNNVWSYEPQAIDPDGDAVVFDLVSAPGGMLQDRLTGKIVWSPMPEQLGRNTVVVSASDGRGGATEQGFTINVSAPLAVAAPVFTSLPITTFSSEDVYHYQPNVQSSIAGALRYSLVESPDGMTIDPGTGTVRWDARSNGLKLYDNTYGFAAPVHYVNFGRIEIPDSTTLRSASVTAEGWFNFADPRAAQYAQLLSKTVTNNPNEVSWGLEYYYGTIRAKVGRADGTGLASVSAPVPVSFGRWTHLAMSFDDSTKTLSLIIDGQVVGTALSPESIGYTNRPVSIGRVVMTATRMRIWNYARSADEIAADRLADVPNDAAGLVLALNFNETRDAATVVDDSPARNHGTLLETPDLFQFPQRLPTLASASSFPVRIRVEDGRGGVSEQSFSISTALPHTALASGLVFDDLNGNGVRDVRPGENMVLNGDFSSGYKAFETDLIYRQETGSFWLGDRQVTTSATSAVVPSTTGHSGHANGDANDLMLVFNGDRTEATVWRQSIPTEVGAEYAFSFWSMRPNNYGPAQLKVSINNQPLGTTFSLADVSSGIYKQFLSTFTATKALSTIEIVLLGNDEAANPNFQTAENVATIDDILLVPIAARPVLVSASASPYLAGMPDGSTAYGSSAPTASPHSVPVTAGDLLRIRATGQTLATSFTSRSADGFPTEINVSALNGLSGFRAPTTGALIGVFLNDESPSGQTPPASLDFRSSGNVPGGINYTAIEPQLRQIFFIGDGLNALGVEQTIVVPIGATRLMLASSGTNDWSNRRGEYEVQLFNSTSEPVQPGRTIFVDSNFNNLYDTGEVSTQTDARGLFSIKTPGSGAHLGMVPLATTLQTAPALPYHIVSADNSVNSWWSSSTTAGPLPQFITRPGAESATVDVTAPSIFNYQAFAQAYDGRPVSYSMVAGPADMFIDRVSGSVRWSPRASDAGLHEVILKITDVLGNIALQRFSLRVTANTSPILVHGPHDQAMLGVPYEATIIAQDAEQSTLHYELIHGPVGMSLDAESGTMRWTPNATGSFLATVRIADSQGASSEHSWSIAVSNASANSAPTFTSPDGYQALVNRRLGLKLTASDPEREPLRFDLVSGPNGMNVTADGQLTWTPGELGLFNAVVRVSDSRGLSATQSLSIESITRPSSDNWSISSTPTTSALVDQVTSYDVVAEGANLFELLTHPPGMSIDPQRGTLRWLPTTDHLGVHRVTLRASNHLGQAAEQSFTLAVRSAAIVPTISSAPPTEAAVGRTYLYTPSVSNPSRSPLTFAIPVAPPGMQIDTVTGAITWTPTAAQLGSTSVILRATDAVGNFTSQGFTVAVLAGSHNRVPNITSVADADAVVGQAYVYTLMASDPDGETLTYAVRSAPAGFNIDPSTGVVSWIPSTGDVGTVTAILTATDPQGGMAVQSLAIDVRSANREPSIRSNPILTVPQGGLYRYDVLAQDPDREPLFYELVTGPTGMAIDALGRTRWQTQLDTPQAAHPVSLRVRDGLGATATHSYTLAVVRDQQAPRLSIVISGEPVLYPWTIGPAIVRVIATDDVGLASVTLKVDGHPVELAPDGTARVHFTAPGNGRLEALATDAAGNVGRAVGRINMRSGEEDGSGNPAPDVHITNINNNATVSGLVDVVGTAASPDFESYTLSYRRADDTSFKTIASGTAQVTAGLLGKWDTTLLENDNYVLKLEVTDTFGSFAATEVEVSVTGSLKLGNFRLTFEDMSISLAGVPLTIARTYDSLRADKPSDFGYGWRMEFRNTDLRTSLPKSGLEDLGIYTPFKAGVRVTITLPGGAREGFTFTPEIRVLPGFGQNSFLVTALPRFTPDPGVRSTLSAGTGRLIANEFGEMFASGGIPWNPANPDFGGYLLTTKEGMQYSIDGSTGKMLSATDRNGNSVSFSETAIQSSTGEAISIRRDTQGRIVELIDPAGKSVRYSYSSHGDLQSMTDRSGNITQLRYAGTGHYLEQVIDPLGRVGVRVQYDADGRLVKAIGGGGSQSTISYDVESNVVSVADPLGRVTTTEYDELGNAIQVVDASGATTRFVNDGNGQVLARTNSLGHTTRFAYDVRGNQTESIDPLGNKTMSTYDRFGNVIAQVDALGNSTRSNYDPRGNLLSIVDALGHVTQLTSVGRGQLSQVTTTAGLRLGLEYGPNGSVVRSTDASGRVINFVTNATGQIIESHSSTQLGSQVTTLSETKTYDANGRLTSETNAAGGKTEYVYDAAGQLVAKIDALGRRTSYQYDEAGRRVATQFADNSREQRVFDQAGQLITVIDVMNRSTHHEYDQLGRLISTIYPDDTPNNSSDNPRTRTEYDAAGNILATIDETGLRTESTYDAAGRPIRIRQPGGGVKLISYDAAGNVISETNELGHTTSYRYNELGQMVASVDSLGRSVQLAYNADGQRTHLIDATGATSERIYGVASQLQAIVDPLGHRTDYTYDNRGLLIATSNANGQTTRFTRDALGREVERTLPGGQKFVTHYDPVGNVTRTIDPDGNEVRFEYDLRNRMTRKIVGTAVTTYTYSASGTVLSVVDSRGTTVYRYDARDRLIEQIEPDGKTLRYTYDAASRRLSLNADGSIQEYEYDSAGRLAVVRTSSGQVTRYSYDLAGSLVRTEYPNGVIETRQVNEAQQLTRITATLSGSTLTDFRYVLDANDRVVRVVEADGRQTDFEYDRAGRMITETVKLGNNVHKVAYHFDSVGNRLQKVDSANGVTTYVYDANDRLVSSTQGGVTTTYTFNASGDLISAASSDEQLTNTWDAEHRLVSTTRVKAGVSKTEQYRYDDQGNRVAMVDVDGQVQRFLLDTTVNYPKLWLSMPPTEYS